MSRVLSVADLSVSETASRFEGKDHDSTISFFVTRHPPGKGVPLHRHPYEETFILHQGSATFRVDAETVEADAGQIVVVPAGAAHGFVSSGGEALRLVSIHPSDRVVQEWLED